MDNNCKNHPDKKAFNFCHNCGNYYCEDCLNEGSIYYYCNDEVCLQKFVEEGPRIKGNSNSKFKIGFTLGTILIVAIMGTIGKELAKKIFTPSESISVEATDWKIRSIADSGLLVETPFELSKGKIDLPAEYLELVEEMTVTQYSSDPISFNATYVIYDDHIIPSLDGAANGAINNMRIAKDVSDFTATIRNIYLGSIPGRMIEGSFTIKKNKAEYKGVVYANDQRTWQVLCIYLAQDKNRMMVNRIINSIQITL